MCIRNCMWTIVIGLQIISRNGEIQNCRQSGNGFFLIWILDLIADTACMQTTYLNMPRRKMEDLGRMALNTHSCCVNCWKILNLNLLL